VPRCSSTFLTTTLQHPLTALKASFLLFSIANMACTPKRSTRRREYETPRRSRFCAYLEEGHSQKYAAQLAIVPRTTARDWISTGDRRTGKTRIGRPLIISDTKVEEIIKWMMGHFDQRALPLQEIAKIHGIKACDNTILAAFTCHSYHHHVPDYKPFLSEATKLKRYTFSIAN
jgi:hypothetical protein